MGSRQTAIGFMNLEADRDSSTLFQQLRALTHQSGSGVAPGVEATDGPSNGLHCGLDGRKQSRVIEWCEQKPRCALLEHSSTNRLIFLTTEMLMV